MDEREEIITALYAFVAQRPGMDPRNYNDFAGYRQELRQVTNDRHHAERLLGAIRWRTSITADKLKEAFKRAFMGRLSWVEQARQDNQVWGKLEYCTGQYFATEYRKAVAAVCAAALWDYWREGYTPERMEALSTANGGPGIGNLMRESARKEFGATIQRRYFN